jgi:cell division septum initiation protein DivIVA
MAGAESSMDILRLLEDLKKLIEDTPSLGPITWGLDRDEIGMQIAKIRASLPQELKAAVSTVRESERIIDTAREDATMTLENARKEAERILAEAKADADRVLEQARLQQERMVADSEILKLSKAQSEEIRNSADRDAVQMRRGAEKYAYDVLSQLEGVVGKVMTTIERGKQEMHRPEPAPNNTPERVAREKTRV